MRRLGTIERMVLSDADASATYGGFGASESLAADLRHPCGLYIIHILYVYGSNFDPDKDAVNIVKHGLSLVEGEGVLNDPQV